MAPKCPFLQNLLQIWSLEMDSPLQSLRHDNKIYSIKWSPKGDQILARYVCVCVCVCVCVRDVHYRYPHPTPTTKCPCAPCLIRVAMLLLCHSLQRLVRSHNEDLEGTGGGLPVHARGAHQPCVFSRFQSGRESHCLGLF